MRLVLRAKVSLLLEVLKHLPDLVGAGKEAVISLRRDPHDFHVVPERPQREDEIVPGVGATADGEDAAVRQSTARAEGGGDDLPDLADITRVDDAFAWIHGHRPAAATARERLGCHRAEKVLKIERCLHERVPGETG